MAHCVIIISDIIYLFLSVCQKAQANNIYHWKGWMHFTYSPYIIPLLAAAVITLGIFVYSLSLHRTTGAIALALLEVAVTGWLLGYALEIAGADLATKLFFGKCQYIGIVFTPLMWLIFAYNHANQAKIMNHRAMGMLAVIPVITLILAFTTEKHGLIWSEFSVYQSGAFSALKVTHGAWFWVFSIYANLLLLAGTYIILRSIFQDKGLFRRQAITLLIAVLAPWIGNLLYVTGLSPIPNLDLTPFGFAISSVAITLSIFSFRLVDLSPIARYRVVDEMQDAMIVLDSRNQVADINLSAQKLVGWSAGQAIGKTAKEVFSRWEELVEILQEGNGSIKEIDIGEEGNPAWYELTISPLYDRRKRQMGRVVIGHNITLRKKAEARIAQLSRAVEASPVSIVITDTQASIQYVNPKFTQLTGYSFAEALGQNPRILKTDQTPAEVHRQLWEALQAGKEWHGEFCNRKKNGELYWELASISPITGANGQITHYVAVKEDITGRKLAEKELAIAHDRALEASRLKSQLLAKVSHELRTPLGGILGYAELLNCGTFGTLTESQVQATAQIIESSHYLDIMVSELLDEAQIESHMLILNNRPVSPAAILKRVESSMSLLCRNKGLSFDVSIAPDLPEELIGDEHRLQEILINLTGNAIKFTQAGEVRIKLYQPDPTHWALQVADTGAGIPEEAQTYIFEPFRQVNNAITHENRGTGLGLSITKHLAELMGGYITLESQIGRGSTFTVVLPLEKSIQVKQ
ncbi:MAG: PAS domain S-box protein [Chloroflexota bacterium]|nr:MAG: PAS domain S-box protein [Chloroflexota bacterium]